MAPRRNEPDQPGLPADRESMKTAHWLGVTLYSIGDAVIVTDTEARVTFMNPVAEEITGWNSEEAFGVPLEKVFKIVNEGTRQPVESPVVRALRDGVIVGLANHTLLIAKDGTERPIDDSAAPIRDEEKEVAGVVLVFRDISERKHLERSLKDALDYCTNIIATLRESLLILDKDLRVVSANRSFYKTFRVSPEETEGKLVFELGSGQWEIPRLRALLVDVLPDNHAFDGFEVGHEFASIGKKTMLLNARRINKPGDHSDLILLAIEDVSDRVAAERRLSISETRYRRLFEAARDGILILNAETMRIVDSNPFMHELLGYSHAELQGKELWEIGLFRDRNDSGKAVLSLRSEGYVRYEDLPLETAKGKVQEVEFICNRYEEDGEAVVQCNIRDITERKQMERQIQEQARFLADVSRRKDEFLAMLSHELRNPMAPIFNAVQLLQMIGGENANQREARGVIERQVRHLSRLTDDLLEVSRVTTGRVRLSVERVDLNGIVNGAVERLETVISRRKQQLSLSRDDRVIWLRADAARLEQVIGNLLSNASKYNNQGGRIWLTVEGVGQEAVIRVRDDGIGMAPEVLSTVFDLFAQADKSLDRSEGGLGIGLALAKSLVEMHRGTIEGRSDGLGRGSEFIVRLPRDETPVAEREALTGEPVEATNTLRILVVEDNVDAANMSALLLRCMGHEVRTVHNGTDTVRLAPGFQPHVIFCDIGLPDMDGYEVARRIRHDAHLAGVLLVAVTGYGRDHDRQNANDAGFDHHLTKPVEPDLLKELLSNVPREKPRG